MPTTACVWLSGQFPGVSSPLHQVDYGRSNPTSTLTHRAASMVPCFLYFIFIYVVHFWRQSCYIALTWPDYSLHRPGLSEVLKHSLASANWVPRPKACAISLCLTTTHPCRKVRLQVFHLVFFIFSSKQASKQASLLSFSLVSGLGIKPFAYDLHMLGKHWTHWTIVQALHFPFL